jgi:hypothetical protein
MREVSDANGQLWDVTLGKESYGTMVLLFSRRDGGEIRKVILGSETPMAAEAELDSLGDERLRERLAEATRWE